MECTCALRRPGARLIRLLCLCLLCTALPVGPERVFAGFTQDDLDHLSHYYLHPDPQSLPGVLESLAGSKYLSSLMESGGDLSGTAFLFARAARSEPGLEGRYREVFRRTGHDGRVLLARVFGFMGGEGITAYLRERLEDPAFARERGEIMKALSTLPAGVDAYKMPIASPADLDILWAEFMITGDARAVERIIGVLERPDETRERMERYLRKRPVDQNDGLVAAIRNNLWILCDTKAGKVATAKDVHISLVVMGLRPEHPREAMRYISETLGVDREMLYRAALKGSAAWSLMSNAQAHPGILSICADNARGRSLPVKMALLCVPACFHEDRLQIDEAVSAFRDMAKADPTNIDVHLHLMRLAIEKRDLEGARRELALFRVLCLDPWEKVLRELAYLEKLLLGGPGTKEIPGRVAGPAVVREASRRAGLLKSYSTEAFLFPAPLTRGIRCPSPVRYLMECEKPGRFWVSRRTISDPREMPSYESWITLDGDHYSSSRTWCKVRDAGGAQDRENAMLGIDAWVRLMEANPTGDARVLDSQGNRYYCLSFPVERADGTLAGLVSRSAKGIAEIWIHAATHDIAACELRSPGPDGQGKGSGLLLQQVFGDFDSAGPVVPPDEYTDLTRAGSRNVL